MCDEKYYYDIPIGKENAITYSELCNIWNCSLRQVRRILNNLTKIDNGDNYIIIRSSKYKGFYKTDNLFEIEAYKKEYTNRALNCFAPSKKVNRVLKNNIKNTYQTNMFNNLKCERISNNYTQTDIVKKCNKLGVENFDISVLSRIENGFCIPTPKQLLALSIIYNKSPNELINLNDISLYVK